MLPKSNVNKQRHISAGSQRFFFWFFWISLGGTIILLPRTDFLLGSFASKNVITLKRPMQKWENRDFCRFSKDFSRSRQSFQVLSKVSGAKACVAPAAGRAEETFAENLKIFEENAKMSERTNKNRRFSTDKKQKQQ